jgi:hypothetical protein
MPGLLSLPHRPGPPPPLCTLSDGLPCMCSVQCAVHSSPWCSSAAYLASPLHSSQHRPLVNITYPVFSSFHLSDIRNALSGLETQNQMLLELGRPQRTCAHWTTDDDTRRTRIGRTHGRGINSRTSSGRSDSLLARSGSSSQTLDSLDIPGRIHRPTSAASSPAGYSRSIRRDDRPTRHYYLHTDTSPSYLSHLELVRTCPRPLIPVRHTSARNLLPDTVPLSRGDPGVAQERRPGSVPVDSTA